MKKSGLLKISISSICLICILFLTHCTRKNGNLSSQNSISNKPIRMGYFANLTHAQAIIGAENRTFDQAIAPAQLQTKIFNAGPSLMEALFADEIDIAYVGPGPALNAFQKSRGEEVRVVAGAAANGVSIVATPSSKIENFQDLKGKKLATPQLGNTQDISARHFLKNNFGSESLKNIVPVPNAEMAGLMSRGEIAAAWVPEPWGTLLITQNNAKLVAEEKDLWPDKQFILTVVVVSKKFLTERPEALVKLLGVHAQLTSELNATPEKYYDNVITAIFKITGRKIDKDIVKTAMKNVRFTTDPMPSTFETYAKWKEELDLGKSNVSLKTLFETIKLDQNRNITSDVTKH